MTAPEVKRWRAMAERVATAKREAALAAQNNDHDAWNAACIEEEDAEEDLADVAHEAIPAMARIIEEREAVLTRLANAAEAVVNGEFDREASERADALFACLEQALAEARAALGRGEP